MNVQQGGRKYAGEVCFFSEDSTAYLAWAVVHADDNKSIVVRSESDLHAPFEGSGLRLHLTGLAVASVSTRYGTSRLCEARELATFDGLLVTLLRERLVEPFPTRSTGGKDR